MKKFLVLFFVFVNFLFAIDKAAAIQAVKSNPALLDTPQAQQMLQEKGISKDEVLKKINSETSNEAKTDSLKIQNNVNYDVNQTVAKQIKIKKINKTNGSLDKPLSYIPEQKLIKLIQSKRQMQSKEVLKRFGEKFFYNKNSLNKQILAVPEYYQINPKDMIVVQIFGGNDKTMNLEVDNNGNIYLPVIGPVYVAGLSVAQVKDMIKRKLKPTYRNSKIVVDVKVNSFIQVSLTGYVKAPGIYNLSSLSTVKDLLIAANGFGKLGSMRKVYLKRNGKVIKIIDFYQLIKDGKLVDTTLLRNGDIIYVPRAEILVSLSGAVSTPAIYEMKKNETLQNLITYSGGLLPQASDKYIKIKRFVNNSSVKVFFKGAKDNFTFKNGDMVYVYKISELNQDYVKVYGNIEKPGSYGIPKDKKLSTLLKKLVYLKDTYYDYGVLRRFNNRVISSKGFNLKSGCLLKSIYLNVGLKFLLYLIS